MNCHSACDKSGYLTSTTKCKSRNVCCYCYVVIWFAIVVMLLLLCCCCYVAGNREKSSQGTTGKLQDNSNLWPNLQPVSSPCDIDNIELVITLLVSKWFSILFPSTRLSTEQQKYIKVLTLSYFIDTATVQNCSQIFSPSAGCIAGCSTVVVFHCCQSPSPEIQHQTQQVSRRSLANTACTYMVSNIHAPHVMLLHNKASEYVSL